MNKKALLYLVLLSGIVSMSMIQSMNNHQDPRWRDPRKERREKREKTRAQNAIYKLEQRRRRKQQPSQQKLPKLNFNKKQSR